MRMADPNDRANRRKQATLYDAVAGRVGYEGFLGEDAPTKYRDTVSRSNIAIPRRQDEVVVWWATLATRRISQIS
jgi:hypothetical protein